MSGLPCWAASSARLSVFSWLPARETRLAVASRVARPRTRRCCSAVPRWAWTSSGTSWTCQRAPREPPRQRASAPLRDTLLRVSGHPTEDHLVGHTQDRRTLPPARLRGTAEHPRQGSLAPRRSHSPVRCVACVCAPVARLDRGAPRADVAQGRTL